MLDVVLLLGPLAVGVGVAVLCDPRSLPELRACWAEALWRCT